MSLRPIKGGRRHRSHAPRLEGGNWGAKRKSEFTDFRKWGKVGILAGVIVLGILATSYAYYSNVYLPSQPQPTSQLDPFTTLWNGEIASSYSTSSGSSGSIAFSSKVNATCQVSCGGVPVDTVLTFPSITSGLTDTIIIEWWASHAISARFSVSDSSLNPYTSRLNVTSPANGIDVYFASAPSSTSGSLVVTLTSTAQNVFGGVVSDYSGAIGFGNTASNTGSTGIGTTSGTSTITITSSATSSFILEFMGVSGIGGGTTTITASSSQTLRNPDTNAASGAFDVTGVSGSQSLGLHFASTTDQRVFSHGGLELTNAITAAKTCGQVGYQCSNMKIVSGFMQAQSNSSFPAVALTNSSIDLSTGASKAIAFNFQLVTNTPFIGEEFGWFLRANSTLPKGKLYSPTNDTQVALAVTVTVTANKYNYYVYLQRDVGTNLFTGTETPTIPCNQAYSLFICANNSTNADATFPIMPLVLNYTGSANGSTGAGQSYLCNDFGGGSTTCNLGGANNVALSIANTNFRVNYTQPWLNVQNRYYVGLWEKATANPTVVKFKTATSQQSQIISIYSPSSSNANIAEGGFFGWLGHSLGGAYNAAAGVLAPIAGPIFNIGNSLQSAVGSALIQAGNLLIKGLVLLEGLIQSVMNLIGNAAGLGNVGTSFFTIINAVVTFFAGPNFPSLFTNAPTLFTTITNELAIFFPWVPTVLTTASSIVAMGTNSIGFFITIIGFIFQFVSGAFATYLIAFWFIYTGDDSLAGILGLFETTEYLVVGLGLNYLAKMINFALDVVTNLIGMIPKPFIQMVAHEFPRIPGIEVNARFVWPGGSMTEIKNGNMLSAACWVTGILFLDMYESANPALPGSIGFLLPSAVSALAPLAGFIPLLEIMTAFVWGASFLIIPIHWLNNAFDFGEVPFDSAVGTRISGGLGGVRITKATKHFQGRLEKKIAKRMELKAVKESGSSSMGVG